MSQHYKLFLFAILISYSIFKPGLNANAQKSNFTDLDVFSLEYTSSPQISPDGKSIAYLRNGMDIMKDQGKRSIWLVGIDGSNHRKLTSHNGNESQPCWSPDGAKLAYVSSREEGAEIFIHWMATGQSAPITQLENSPGNLCWSPDGKFLAFTSKVPEKPVVMVTPPKAPKGAKWAEKPRVTTLLNHESDGSGYIDPGFRHVFVLPSDGGTPRQITHGNFHHQGDPVWSKDGQKIYISGNRNAEWEYEFRNSEIYRIDVNANTIEAITDSNGPDFSPKISPNGSRIAYLGFTDEIRSYQHMSIRLMNADGSGKTSITLSEDINPQDISWDPNGNGIYFTFSKEGNTKIGYTDLSGSVTTVTGNVGGTTLGRPYSSGSFDVKGGSRRTSGLNDIIVFTKTRPEYPARLTVKTGANNEIEILDLNEEILPYRNLGVTEEIWYTSSTDGRSIQGWIVKPPDFSSEKKYPLLVENHGGPILDYGDRFSAEMQLYAAAGYVVFYPNPRGSTGYGEEFANLLYNNYPGDDYQDVMDGVDELIKRSLVHQDSLFVTGGSAGGIMTAWMVGKNNRFRAAVVVKPVMNWISKTLVADNYYQYANYRYPGQPWENIENYMKFSPISLVGNVSTPTLVMVGMEDLRTPISEAKQLYHALKLRKIETALVEIPGAYHNISARPSQMITKVAHVLAWFNKYRQNDEEEGTK